MLYRDTATVVPRPGRADPRTVAVRLCQWNTPRGVIDPDGTTYREQYAPGSITLAANVHVMDSHHGALVGRADPDTLAADDTGPTVDLTIARTHAGDDVLALIDAGVIRAVSMELEPVDATRSDDLVTRTAAVVHGVAFAFRPQLDAPVLAVRAEPIGETMTDTVLLREADPEPTPAPPPTVNVVDVATLDRAMDDLRREFVTRDTPAGPAHPLARYRSLDEFSAAAWADPAVGPLLYRALADQVPANNPGVIPPAWLSEVYGIVDAGRPLITAFGARPLPPSGMEVDWPYFDGDLSTLVGEQLTPKAPITSVRVDLQRGSAPLRTWAGGSDISYQLIRRSSPSYRDAYMRIMYAAYAAVTDAAAAVAAAATAGSIPMTYDATTDDDGSVLRGLLVEASVAVQAATGSPASFAAAATDVFVNVGSKLPAPGQPVNVVGTATASTLAVSLSGLTVVHDPYLADGKMIVSNRQAGGWFEDGPMPLSAEDVEKLGQNVAVWGMANFGPTAPAGIVVFTCTLPTPVGTARGTKSSK